MAGEGDTERLVVLLEARVRDFEKAMDRAEKKATGSYAGMRKGSKQATDAMERDMVGFNGKIDRLVTGAGQKFQGMGKAMIGGFIGGLAAGGIASIVSRVGEVADGVARVGDEAKRAGLGIKAFQELRYVAEQNRVGVDSLVDGIKELNLRADEWIATGGGAAAEAFERLGYSAEELNKKLQDPSELFTEIIGKLKDLDRAAQIRVADEIFGGTGGEKFVQLIDQGADGIRATIDEANALGLVMDSEMIAKADEVDRKFHQIASTVGTAVQGSIVDITSAMIDFLDAQNEAIRRNRLMAMDADAIAQYDATIVSIEGMLDAVGRAYPEAEARVRDLAEAVMEGQMTAEDAQTALLDLAVNPDLSPIIGEINGLLGVLDLLIGRSRTARQELAAIDPVGRGATWEGLQGTFFPKPRTVPGSGGTGGGSGGRGGGGGRSSAASEADRQAKAVQNVIAALQFERSVLSLNELEQEKANQLRAAGEGATEAQRAEIIRLVEATYTERQAIEAAGEAQREYQDQFEAVTSTLGDAIGQVFSGGIDNAEDFFATVMDGFARIGQANLQNGFDNLFGGGATAPGGNGQTGGQHGAGFWGDAIFALPGAVQKGAEKGSSGGIFNGLGSLFGGNNGQGGQPGSPLMGQLGGALGAAAGGLGMGYQSQDPMMGGLGGAMQGFMAGGGFTPMGAVGAVVGGMGGQVGPFPSPKPQNDNGPTQSPKEKEVA